MKKILIGMVVFLIAISLLNRYLINAGALTKLAKELDAKSDFVKSSTVLPEDYIELFPNKSKINVIQVIQNRNRSPIGEAFYDKKFYLQICKLDTTYRDALNNSIIENFASADVTYHLYYDEYLNDTIPFNVRYKQGLVPQIKHIYFSLFGDKTVIVQKNDSLASFYSIFENFSVKYGKNLPVDIYGDIKTDSRLDKTPIEISFVKKKSTLYLVLLTTIANNPELRGGELYHLLKQ